MPDPFTTEDEARVEELRQAIWKGCEAVSKGDSPEAIARYTWGTAQPLLTTLRELREREARVEDVLFDWVGKDRGPAPRTIAEWGPDCFGCHGEEYRIDGFCSGECRDRYAFAREIREALETAQSPTQPESPIGEDAK